MTGFGEKQVMHVHHRPSAADGIAEQADLSLVELAFRWLISKPATGSVLLGGSKPHQLQANIDVLARGPLEESLVEACNRVGATLRGPMPAYNR